MSLKFFHVVFVTCSILLALLVGAWAADAYMTRGGAFHLGMSIFGFASTVALIVYGGYFLKKFEDESYL